MTKPAAGKSAGKGGGRKPPKEHQWTKGQSGNPRGRPRKATAEPLNADIAQMFVDEGFKSITVIERGKPVSMPAVEAVLRALLVAALKGNAHAARTYIQLVSDAQARQQKQKDASIEAAFKFQMELEIMRTDFVAAGHCEWEMPAHPSDIEIDHVTGVVKYFLALTEDDRRARARCIRFRDFLLGRIARSLAAAAEDGDDDLLQINREAARVGVMRLNEHLPLRFRRVPPGDEPTLSADSPPEALWRATLRPIIDALSRGGNLREAAKSLDPESEVTNRAEDEPKEENKAERHRVSARFHQRANSG